MVARAEFDEIRTLAFGGISGTYADVGTPLAVLTRGFCIVNNTEGDLMFTDDTTKDKHFLKSQSFRLWDVQSNENAQFDDKCVRPIGTQWSVRQLTAPLSGSFYIETLSAVEP